MVGRHPSPKPPVDSHPLPPPRTIYGLAQVDKMTGRTSPPWKLKLGTAREQGGWPREPRLESDTLPFLPYSAWEGTSRIPFMNLTSTGAMMCQAPF